MSKIISLSFIILILFSCDSSSDNSEEKYLDIAWSYIDGNNDTTIIGGKQNGVVNLNSTWGEGIPSITVRFNTTEDALLGPITVHISKVTKKILGVDLRL